jgi:Na+/H+-dicarboxylate symporter
MGNLLVVLEVCNRLMIDIVVKTKIMLSVVLLLSGARPEHHMQTFVNGRLLQFVLFCFCFGGLFRDSSHS